VRLKTYGINEFAGKKKLQPLLIFLSKFRNPLQILLIVAAIVSGILGSHIEAVIILAIVFGSAFIDFFNTYKSAQAAEALQEKVTITAAVMRGGELKERNMREVVPGDIFTLEAGDLVPADAIVLEAKDLFLNEGVLTGESLPVEKTAEILLAAPWRSPTPRKKHPTGRCFSARASFPEKASPWRCSRPIVLPSAISRTVSRGPMRRRSSIGTSRISAILFSGRRSHWWLPFSLSIL